MSKQEVQQAAGVARSVHIFQSISGVYLPIYLPKEREDEMMKQMLFALFTTFFTIAFCVQTASAQETGTASPNASDNSQVYPVAPTESQDAPTREDYEELQERLDMMEGDIERLLGEQDKLKEKSLLDRLNWSGSYRFNANFYHLTDRTVVDYPSHLELDMIPSPNPNAPPGTMVPNMDENGRPTAHPVLAGARDRNDWLSPSWTHRLKLAMTYDFGESLRFYSQLGVYKYFNETLNTIGLIDHGSNAYPRDNAFRLERVYFDWFVSDWLAFSIGRIASPDGPPTELKENQERRSGWGVQVMNATIDTIMATIYLGEKVYLRTFYSPFGSHMDLAVNNDVSLFDDQGLDILHSWGALFETAIPRTESSIFQLGFLHIPKFSPQDINIMPPGANQPISPSEPTGQDLGSFLQASSLLQLNDIFDLGLDIFAAYNLTMIKPTDARMVYEYNMNLDIIDPTTGEIAVNPTTGEAQSAAVPQYREVGLVSYEEDDGKSHFGHAVYAGLRYTLPFNKNYVTRIGSEINWSTRYHVAWSHPNDQLLNKLGNKGLAFEGYIIQQMVPKHLFCRIGYLELKRDFVGTFIGPTNKADQRIRNVYFLVDLSW